MGEWEWVHAVIGGVATFIFLFQTLGAIHHGGDEIHLHGSHADFHLDTDAGDDSGQHMGGSFSDYLSVRNFVALFMGYGWVTLAALLSGASRAVASLLGVCAGLVLVFISLYLIKTFLKFQEDGTLDLKSLAGKHAYVYISVGGAASGTGKVLVDTKAGRAELPARTNDPDTIRPGSLTTILSTDGVVLWVTSKDESTKDQASK